MFRSIIYFILALSTTFYAIPRIPFDSNQSLAIIFSISWLFFAFLILGSHVDRLLILDETKRKRLDQLKKIQRRRREEDILQYQKKQLKRTQQAQ